MLTISDAAARQYLTQGWPADAPPPTNVVLQGAQAIALILANYGQAFVGNDVNNWGLITCVPDANGVCPQGCVMDIAQNPVFGGGVGHQQCFVQYANLSDGVPDFVHTLVGNPAIYAALQMGNSKALARAMLGATAAQDVVDQLAIQISSNVQQIAGNVVEPILWTAGQTPPPNNNPPINNNPPVQQKPAASDDAALWGLAIAGAAALTAWGVSRVMKKHPAPAPLLP